jgi:hypothetical protein
MLRQIALGLGILVATTVIHVAAMTITVWFTRGIHAERWKLSQRRTATILIVIVVLLMFLATLVESFLWALVYLVSDVFPALEPALYFSTVTYTTLGYGDLVVGPDWRILASIQAANGVIMFGWTTGIIIAAVQRLYGTTRA